MVVLFVDGEEEGAGVLEHRLHDIIGGDSGTQVCDLPRKNLNCSHQSVCFAALNRDKWFISRSLLMFTMENCFYVLISQAVRYLKDPAIVPRDKQRLKQELSSELVRCQFSRRFVCTSFSFYGSRMILTGFFASRAPFCPAYLATSVGDRHHLQLAASSLPPSPSPPHQGLRWSMKVRSLLFSSFRPLLGSCKDRRTFLLKEDSENCFTRVFVE